MLVDEQTVLDALAEDCKAVGGQQAWARKHGIVPQWVNTTLRGRGKLSPRIYSALGYRKVPMYEKVNDNGR